MPENSAPTSTLHPTAIPTPTPIVPTPAHQSIIGVLVVNPILDSIPTLTAEITDGIVTGDITYDFDCGNNITGRVGPTNKLSAIFNCAYFGMETWMPKVTITRQGKSITINSTLAPTYAPTPLATPNSDNLCRRILGIGGQAIGNSCDCIDGYDLNISKTFCILAITCPAYSVKVLREYDELCMAKKVESSEQPRVAITPSATLEITTPTIISRPTPQRQIKRTTTPISTSSAVEVITPTISQSSTLISAPSQTPEAPLDKQSSFIRFMIKLFKFW